MMDIVKIKIGDQVAVHYRDSGRTFDREIVFRAKSEWHEDFRTAVAQLAESYTDIIEFAITEVVRTVKDGVEVVAIKGEGILNSRDAAISTTQLVGNAPAILGKLFAEAEAYVKGKSAQTAMFDASGEVTPELQKHAAKRGINYLGNNTFKATA